MGNCRSSQSTRQVATAKLILQDGKLVEFTCPVKVSQLFYTNKVNPKLSIICNADEMDFNSVVNGVPSDELLELGEIYFVLPVSALKRPLRLDEMAALAVKASSALKLMDCYRCGKDLVSSAANKGLKAKTCRRTKRLELLSTIHEWY